jgi:hypothetical protein
MNTDDQGRNLAEGLHARRAPAARTRRPVHGGYPGVPVRVSTMPDPGLPRVDWARVAGGSLAEVQRLRAHMPADVLAEYDRLYAG